MRACYVGKFGARYNILYLYFYFTLPGHIFFAIAFCREILLEHVTLVAMKTLSLGPLETWHFMGLSFHYESMAERCQRTIMVLSTHVNPKNSCGNRKII